MNMVYVASRFDMRRRRQNLSWSHHAELAALDPDQQDYWLDRAESERLSVRCLREEVRRARRLETAKAELEAPAEPHESEDDIVCPHCGGHIRLEAEAELAAAQA